MVAFSERSEFSGLETFNDNQIFFLLHWKSECDHLSIQTLYSNLALESFLWAKSLDVVSESQSYYLYHFFSLNFITIHLIPKWNVSLPPYSLICLVSVTSDCVTCSLLSLLYHLTLFLLYCMSLHIWWIMCEHAALTFSPLDMCLELPYSVENENAQF